MAFSVLEGPSLQFRRRLHRLHLRTYLPGSGRPVRRKRDWASADHLQRSRIGKRPRLPVPCPNSSGGLLSLDPGLLRQPKSHLRSALVNRPSLLSLLIRGQQVNLHPRAFRSVSPKPPSRALQKRASQIPLQLDLALGRRSLRSHQRAVNQPHQHFRLDSQRLLRRRRQTISKKTVRKRSHPAQASHSFNLNRPHRAQLLLLQVLPLDSNPTETRRRARRANRVSL